MNDRRTNRRRYLLWSYSLLALALISFVITGVILDAALASLPIALQRWIVVLTYIMPAGLGVVMGVLALRQRNSHRLLALGSVILNALFSLFFIILLGIAG